MERSENFEAEPHFLRCSPSLALSGGNTANNKTITTINLMSTTQHPGVLISDALIYLACPKTAFGNYILILLQAVLKYIMGYTPGCSSYSHCVIQNKGASKWERLGYTLLDRNIQHKPRPPYILSRSTVIHFACIGVAPPAVGTAKGEQLQYRQNGSNMIYILSVIDH